jgi:hypothetical protein
VYEFLRNNALDAAISSIKDRRRLFNAASLGRRWAVLSSGTRHFFLATTRLPAKPAPKSAAFVPGAASQAAAVASVEPLLNLWASAPAGAPDFNGIAEAFSSHLETIREANLPDR